jgi:oligopeptide/dipeptide ABC transporter ATP-binding protein
MGGRISLDGEDITEAKSRRRRVLSAKLQAVFQDPYSSLNPTRTIGQTLGETLAVHDQVGRGSIDERVREMLAEVGLPPESARRYPAHFSGGQRQRIAIARALIARPSVVICDEPTSALDLSVQAQVLNLLRHLQDEFALSYLFVSHDLAVVRHLADQVMVLYQGRVVEHGDASTVYADPVHPYTQALIAAVPVPDPALQRQRRLVRHSRASNTPGSASQSGCAFAPRCPHAIAVCRSQRPKIEMTASGSLVACHRWPELGRKPASAAGSAVSSNAAGAPGDQRSGL